MTSILFNGFDTKFLTCFEDVLESCHVNLQLIAVNFVELIIRNNFLNLLEIVFVFVLPEKKHKDFTQRFVALIDIFEVD